MAEFLTMQEAEDKFGKKGRTNAALTLGIIGTALGAFAGNNNGCGCGGGNGILGGLFGGNNNCCAMQQAEQAKTMAMAQGEMAQNLAWNNRVQSMQDDIDLYTYINGRNLATNERIGNETQVLTNQIWAKVINTATTGAASYMQVTKFDIIHNTQYTDCKGNVRLVTEETSTILASPATSETITTLVPEVNKVIDVIIPNGVSIVNQAILDELPTSLPVKGNCAYSVFEIQIPAAPAPAA